MREMSVTEWNTVQRSDGNLGHGLRKIGACWTFNFEFPG